MAEAERLLEVGRQRVPFIGIQEDPGSSRGWSVSDPAAASWADIAKEQCDAAIMVPSCSTECLLN